MNRKIRWRAEGESVKGRQKDRKIRLAVVNERGKV